MTDSEKLDLLLQKADGMDQRLGVVEKRLDDMDQRLCVVEKRLDDMDQRLCVVEKHLDDMDQRLCVVEKHIKSVELTLENETNRNIRLIAEGHRDVSRKLDEALQVEHEKEILLIRMNIVENDVDIIKRKLDIA